MDTRIEQILAQQLPPQESAKALNELGKQYQEQQELDAAITFAPSGDVVIAALRSLARGAAVAINAIHLDRIPQFDYGDLWWERSLRSVANFTREDARDFLALAAEIPVRTRIEAHPLAGANDALARLAAGQVSGAAVLVMEYRESIEQGEGRAGGTPGPSSP